MSSDASTSPHVRRGLLLALAGLVLAAGLWSLTRGADGGAVHRAAAPEVVKRGLPVVEGLETLHVELEPESLAALEARRAEALERGLLTQQKGDYVKVQVRFRGEILRGKTRLKGDLTDHLLTNRWSLRFKLERDARLLGMRKFSLQHPMTRAYYNEPIFYELLREEGVLTPRYTFVNVVRNGQPLGVMALEEHFSKELLESQRRREGVIVRFDEDAYWEARAPGDAMSDHMTIKPFRPNYTARKPHLARDLESARGLLRGFLHGELSASQVFHVPTMSSFLAVSELWDSWHALRWHNLRFYYNPLLAKLEPIAFDGMLGDQHRNRVPELLNGSSRSKHLNTTVTARMLEDSTMREAMLSKLTRMATDYVEGPGREAVAKREAEWRERLAGAGLPQARLVSDAQLGRAQELIALSSEQQATTARRAQAPTFEEDTGHGERADREQPSPLAAYLVRGEDGMQLELYNRTRVPVRVTSLAGATPVRDARLPITLPVQTRHAPYVRTRLPVSVAADVEVRVHSEDMEGGRLTAAKARPYSAVRTREVLPAPGLADFLRRHPAFVHDDGGLRLPAATHLFREPLVLPRATALTVEAGAVLRFGAGAHVLLRGPLHLAGRADAPVVLEPLDAQAGWRGLAVLEAGAPSRIEHAVVRHTSGVATDDWGTTGGLVFYESELHVRDLAIEGTAAEDGLNVIRAALDAERLLVRNTASDAVDLDFCTGRIVDGRFEGIGADAIDTSGSRVTVERSHFTAIGDKALSAGERSSVQAKGLTVRGARVGVASKDSSTVELQDSSIHDASFAALAAFQKKPEYGGGTIEARALTLDEEGEHAVAHDNSSIEIDGRAVPTRSFELSQLYPELLPQRPTTP